MTETQNERTSTLELRDYFRILSLRKWTAFFVFAAVVGGVLYLSYRQKPVYQSEARVLVPPPTLGVGPLGQPIEGKVDTATEAQIAASKPVAVKVATGLNLDATDDTIIQRLLKAIQVAPDKNGSVLIFRSTAPEPVLARDIAEQFGLQYLDYRRSSNVSALQAEVDSLNLQIRQAQDAITKLGPAAQYGTAEASQASNLNAQIFQYNGQKGLIQAVITSLKQSSGGILQDAKLPTKPARPNHLRDGLLAGIVGLALGFGAAFLRDYVDDSLRGVADVERQSGATLIGVIPHVVSDLKKKEREGRNYLVAAEDPKAPATEAYRTLRTNLLFMAATGPLKVLLVTSPLQGEGKTTTAANLAVVMAQAGQRVLLVGADLRRPSLHRFFGVSNRVGLSGVLAGQADLSEAVLDPGLRDLRVIPGGPIPPNPTELLGSPRMRGFIDEVRGVADWVILDGPPALGLADALVLSAISDGQVTVVNEATNRRVLAHARDQLAKVQARTVGAILNNFGPAFSYYYSDYYLYSSSYYQQTSEPEEPPRKLPRKERKQQAKRAAGQAVAFAGGNGDAPQEPRKAPAAEKAATGSGDLFS